MSDVAQQLLQQLIHDHGIAIVEEPRRLESLIKDYAQGQHKREVNLWLLALREGIVQELRSSAVPLEMLCARAVKRLCEDHAIDQESARWVVDTWTVALQLRKPVIFQKEQENNTVQAEVKLVTPMPLAANDHNKESDGKDEQKEPDKFGRQITEQAKVTVEKQHRLFIDAIISEFDSLKKERDKIGDGWEVNLLLEMFVYNCYILFGIASELFLKCKPRFSPPDLLHDAGIYFLVLDFIVLFLAVQPYVLTLGMTCSNLTTLLDAIEDCIFFVKNISQYFEFIKYKLGSANVSNRYLQRQLSFNKSVDKLLIRLNCSPTLFSGQIQEIDRMKQKVALLIIPKQSAFLVLTEFKRSDGACFSIFLIILIIITLLFFDCF